MQNGIHFISGLPRAGSTLLAAILRQNPRFFAAMTSPVGSLVSALQREMSQSNEFAVLVTDAERAAVLRAAFDAYYHALHPTRLVFDTNRLWCAKLPLLAALFPGAKIIACVRHVPWVLDSLERLIRRNPLQPSKIFNFETGGTVYSRIEGLAERSGLVGFAWHALKEAFYGEHADRLLLLTYETLTREPARAIAALYDFIGEPRFVHDFDNLAYDAAEFDARLGTPGLHTVARMVHQTDRETILPPDLFRRFEEDSFWRNPALNQRRVPIV